MAGTPSYTTKPNCPHCNSTITSVIYSPGPVRGRKHRWRRCAACGERFKTTQDLDPRGPEQSHKFLRTNGSLSIEQVRQIRSELALGKPHQLIADFMGIARERVTNINCGNNYRNIK